MRGSRSWRRRVRANTARYERIYGYVTEARLMRWRFLRARRDSDLREALATTTEPAADGEDPTPLPPRAPRP